jgi:hypothetical protein
MIHGIGHEGLPDPSRSFELVIHEHIDHRAAAAGRRADNCGILYGARQKEIIGRLETNRDSHAGTVNVVNRLQRRILGHHVRALDYDVGRAELDLSSTHRLDRDESDVPFSSPDRVEHLASGGVGHQLDWHTQPAAELTREIGRKAFGFTGGGIGLCEHGIAEVDRRMQFPPGREIF